MHACKHILQHPEKRQQRNVSYPVNPNAGFPKSINFQLLLNKTLKAVSSIPVRNQAALLAVGLATSLKLSCCEWESRP